MLQNIQRLNTIQRQLVFFLIFGGGLMLLIAVTVLLISASLNSGRVQSIASVDTVSVQQFAALPDDNAYPAAVAAFGDSLYTGSYATGAIWRVDASGQVSELPGTRDAIGAVSGLVAAPDGSLYVVDQLDTDTRSAGGDVKRIAPDGTITSFATIDDVRGFLVPDDITLDSDGRVYVTDRGRDEVWRFDADGGNGILWWAPTASESGPQAAVTGLAYDPTTNAVIVTDPETNAIYRIPVESAEAETLYQSPANSQNSPGFDGVTVSPDGVIYVAALGQNTVMKLDDGQIETLARNFRGASDVDYGVGDRLYVANWDQAALVLPLVQPRLPFAIDVIELK